jgi:hypothetical protein
VQPGPVDRGGKRLSQQEPQETFGVIHLAEREAEQRIVRVGHRSRASDPYARRACV